MALYETLASLYDSFFPFPQATADFLPAPGTAGDFAMDIGCATGDCCIALAQRGWNVIGIDPSDAMIQLAEDKVVSAGLDMGVTCLFRVGTMEDVTRLLPGRGVNLATCLGNTLPHLESASALDDFLRTMHSAIVPGGMLVLQLLNYGRIIRERPSELPEIESGGYSFKRRYRYESDGSITFLTSLSGGTEGILQDETRLTPFAVEDIIERLGRSGFEPRGTYSSWTREAFDEATAVQCIVEAQRRVT